MVRLKTRPSPLSQVNVTGWLGVRLALAGAVHSVFASGTLALVPLAATSPCSANRAPGDPAGDRKVMVGLVGSIVSVYLVRCRSSISAPFRLIEPSVTAVF